MSKFFGQLKSIVLIPILLGLVACTAETYPPNTSNALYATGTNSQFTDTMLTTPNAYTYYRPIQFGHVDMHANEIYSPVYQAPLAIYPHYQH
jgi:hypothetical protein